MRKICVLALLICLAFSLVPAPAESTTYGLKDSYSAGANDVHVFQMASGGYSRGQSFTTGSAYTLKRVSVPLKQSGAGHYLIYCYIYNITLGSTSGTILATSTTTYYTDALAGAYTWYDFDFSGLSLSNATVYYIVLATAQQYAGQYVYWQGANAGNPYAGGTAFYKQDNYPTYWTELTNQDANFKTYNSYDAPTVTTQAASAVLDTTATGNGNVTSDGGSTITERGTVYSLSANPTTADTKDTAAGTTGAFTTSIDSLTPNTTYHLRAYAINADSTTYGEDVTFTTLDDPAVSTVAASNVAATTARINGSVTFDGNQDCDIRFAYDNATHANFADYAHITAWENNTYSTGQTPYYDLSSLTTSTTYYFRVQIANDISSATGSELNFTTTSGVNQPASLTVIPTDTTISASWPKGSGSTYSLLRYSTSTYPTAVTEGSSAYLGTGNSVQISSLIPGTTYYFSIWGMSGGTYSTNYTTAICTTLAYSTSTGSVDIDTPAPNSSWAQTPSASTVETWPGAVLIEMFHNSYGVPINMAWYFVWLVVGIGGGIIFYNRTSQNVPMIYGVELVWFGLGSVIGLTMLWIVVVLIVIGMGFTAFGNRH